jgi:hypothetical protein
MREAGAPSLDECPQTVLFEASIDILLGKQNLNDFGCQEIAILGKQEFLSLLLTCSVPFP